MKIYCNRCGQRVKKPGALIFSPPQANGMCQKSHLCAECWAGFLGFTLAEGKGKGEGELGLKPGWLRKDVERASQRLDQVSPFGRGESLVIVHKTGSVGRSDEPIQIGRLQPLTEALQVSVVGGFLYLAKKDSDKILLSQEEFVALTLWARENWGGEEE